MKKDEGKNHSVIALPFDNTYYVLIGNKYIRKFAKI